MIELAPLHKIGLPVPSPILLAGGSVAYGESIPKGIDPAKLGGVVIGPITHRSQRGSEPPRLGETVGGMVLDVGIQNRGAARVVKLFGRIWPRLGCPVIAQVADTHPEEAHATARHLGRVQGLTGLELLLPPYAQADDLFDLVEAIRPVWDLPIWVKLPLEGAVELAYAGAEAGADALVVGQPSRGSGFHPSGAAVTGSLYGPLSFAPMLNGLLQVARLELGLPLIACGGLHTPQQIRQALAAGASAVQLDSQVWVEPGMVGELAAQFGRA